MGEIYPRHKREWQKDQHEQSCYFATHISLIGAHDRKSQSWTDVKTHGYYIVVVTVRLPNRVNRYRPKFRDLEKYRTDSDPKLGPVNIEHDQSCYFATHISLIGAHDRKSQSWTDVKTHGSYSRLGFTRTTKLSLLLPEHIPLCP